MQKAAIISFRRARREQWRKEGKANVQTKKADRKELSP
jgi:hypothetical protein